MASRVINQANKLKSLYKSEIIWRNIPRVHDNSFRVNRFKETLKDLTNSDRREISNILYFPRNTFLKYPTHTVKGLIQGSLQIFNEKNIVNDVDIYNSVLKSYIENLISFEVIDLLEEMNGKEIQFNEKTYELLIELYSEDGCMANVEALLESMNSKNQKLHKTTKTMIVRGYIIAGQPEKSKEFMRKNNLNENSIDVLINEGKGYASLGNIEKVIDIIDKMKQENFVPYGNVYFAFYQRLAKANAPDSDLEQILNIMDNPDVQSITNCILSLNKIGLFNCSLRLVTKFQNRFTNPLICSNLVTSFNSKDCPVVTYKNLLSILMDHVDPRGQKHLFSNISYEESAHYARKTAGGTNARPILSSLLNRAIQEGSVEAINNALTFEFHNWQLREFNLVLYFEFIPAMLRSGLASSCEDLLNLLHSSRTIILPVVLLYSLCRGNFSEFNKLKSKFSATSEFFLNINTRSLASEIIRNLSLKEIHLLVGEVSETFHTTFVNRLVSDIVIEKIILAAKSGNVNEIVESVKLAEDSSVHFTLISIDRLMKSALEYKEIFKPLLQRISNVPADEGQNNE